jgi:hypothetical protein
MHNISRICQLAQSLDFCLNQLLVEIEVAMVTIVVVVVVVMTYSNDHLRLRRIW